MRFGLQLADWYVTATVSIVVLYTTFNIGQRIFCIAFGFGRRIFGTIYLHLGLQIRFPRPTHYTRLELLITVLLMLANGLLMSVLTTGVVDASARASRLLLANLIPLCFLGWMTYFLNYARVSRETQNVLHQALASIVIIQASFHSVVKLVMERHFSTNLLSLVVPSMVELLR